MFYNYKTQAPNMNKWQLGKKYFLEGICHWNHIKTAINAVHYYAWFGDPEWGVEKMAGAENDTNRHHFFMRLLDKCSKALQLPGHLMRKVEGWSKASSRWRKGCSAKDRQQSSNVSSHKEAIDRIVATFALMKNELGIMPSINQIANKAKANWHTVKRVLLEKNILGGEPKEPPVPVSVLRQSSTSSADKDLSCSSTTFKEKDQNISDEQRSVAGHLGGQLSSLAAKIKRAMPWKPISNYEASIHAHKTCHLEIASCRICGMENACLA